MTQIATQTTKSKRAVWTRAEWLKIVTQIHESNPQLHLHDGSALIRLHCIKPRMVEAAMKLVIEPARFRTTFATSTFVVALERAILDLHESLHKPKEQPVKAQEQTKPEAPKLTHIAEEVMQVPEEMSKLIAAESKAGPYELAFSPLIQLIANEVTRQMEPRMGRLEQMLQALLDKESITLEPKPVITGFGEMGRRISATARKPRIAVVGILPIQEVSIRADFPGIQFTFVEKGPTGVMQTVQNCDRIIGMTKFLNHATDGMLRKGLGSRYVRIAGGPSEVKRVIELWINSGVISVNITKETAEPSDK